MYISWFGLSSFKIVSKNITIITDPFGSETGLRPPKGNADIVLVSADHEAHNSVSSISGTPMIVDLPGEYDIKGVMVQGIASEQASGDLNVIYVCTVEDVRVVFLGRFGQADISKEQIEALGQVDVLVLPVGGHDVLNAKQASNIIEKIEPTFVVPAYFKIPGVAYSLDGEQTFKKEMGYSTKPEDRLKVDAKMLETDAMQVVPLNPQR